MEISRSWAFLPMFGAMTALEYYLYYFLDVSATVVAFRMILLTSICLQQTVCRDNIQQQT